jgi:hypothetical protein
MKIFQQGDHGVAIAPELGRVRVVYRYRKLTLESGIEVENVLVGVHQDTGEVLVIPAQSAPVSKRHARARRLRSWRHGFLESSRTSSSC